MDCSIGRNDNTPSPQPDPMDSVDARVAEAAKTMDELEAVFAAGPPPMSEEVKNATPTFPERPQLKPKMELDDILKFSCSDDGNAERIVLDFAGYARYCYTTGKWLIWAGTHWATDEKCVVIKGAIESVRAAKKAAALAMKQATAAEDTEALKMIKPMVSHLGNSLNTGRLKAMLELSQVKLGILEGELDTDKNLLSVKNGTLNLCTGELKKHDRDDLITHYVDVEYVPNAKSAVWDKFLDDITQNEPRLKEYLQRAAGYTATGNTCEQELFILHGPSKTGKSLFVNTIAYVLGGYAKMASSNTFEARRDNTGPRSDIARLKNARMVVVSETGEGKKFDHKLIKSLTGGTDKITVAAKYKDDEEFDPTFKLWFACNHKPKLDSTDGAIWKRINLIPFHNAIADANIDKYLAAKLQDPEVATAILAWVVIGCLWWKRDGLAAPAIVTDYTGEYRGEMDGLSEFIEECCTFGDPKTVGTPAAEFTEAYRRWCTANGQDHPLGPRTIKELLDVRGNKKVQHGPTRRWCYMGIVCDPNAIVRGY